ncbi:WD repeat-containing protein on Y chromosome-like [Gouania willdenowi]|uniref:WD repeat-containing protein on Y chromosome-like n=1 Tax=Gouania willdenowi TaxID=441366 RepID=UPI00105671A4|nr:WD repeat-containing protein on Y chromosome-like [Gouania willdenowi]
MGEMVDVDEHLKDNVHSMEATEGNTSSTGDIKEDTCVIQSSFTEENVTNEKEFVSTLLQLYPQVKEEDLKEMHEKITKNSGTPSLLQVVNYISDSGKGFAYRRQLFDKPFEIIKTGHTKRIVRLLCVPLDDYASNMDFKDNRPYQNCQYVSITAGGSLVSWSQNFQDQIVFPLYENEKPPLPYSHKKKITITDMLYLKEYQELVVSSFENELIFYYASWAPVDFWVKHCLIVEDGRVTTMHYWSDGNRAVFTFGDTRGYLYVFTTSKVNMNDIFDKSLFRKTKLWEYPTAYVSTLLKANNPKHQCICVPVFKETCSSVKFIPELNSIAVCSSSSKNMVLLRFSSDLLKQFTKKIFPSDGFPAFSSVEYCTLSQVLVTGGTDGVMRIWSPNKKSKCIKELKAQDTKITHLVYNIEEGVILSISVDMKVCVWRETQWVCTQTISPEGMKIEPCSTITYNLYNNELFLANSEIARCPGKGTKPLKKSVPSHLTPICSVIYHQDTQQVVSVSVGGLVTVWNLVTERAVMQLKATFDNSEGHTAFLFDESQRKLITVSPDGKVRTWSFHNGHQLPILYPTLPNESTGFVCKNNRLFVSVKNNPNLFVLDIEGEDHRILNHGLLKDIVAIDTHQEHLITASSEGNVVIWDVKTEEVCFCIIGGVFPQGFVATEEYQGYRDTLSASTLYFARSSTRTTVNKTSYLVKCLKTREESLHTATLLTTSEGYICAWSLKRGLLVKFLAVTEEGATITSWSTDPTEHTLITGDSTGKVCLWDIQTFALEGHPIQGPFLTMGKYSVSVCPPRQPNAWQVERSPVKSVVCDEDCKKFIVAGMMGKLTVFTNTGDRPSDHGVDSGAPLGSGRQWTREAD